MRMYKVLMCGDRNWGDSRSIMRELRWLVKKHGANRLLVIEGGASGADLISRHCAHELSVHTAEVLALWDTRYRGAGPQRNAVMSALEPDEGIAFHPNLSKSKGTKDMVARLRKSGIPVKVVTK